MTDLKLRVWIKDHFMTDIEWTQLRRIGWYFDVVNGDMRQVINWGTYEERIVTDIETSRYTGLKDVKEKDIFEGDLLEGDSVVCFANGMFIPRYDFGNAEVWEDVFDWNNYVTVIGNVYENADLLN